MYMFLFSYFFWGLFLIEYGMFILEVIDKIFKIVLFVKV